MIITDDVGYGDIGSYGARDVRTPNIDRLARQGTRFTDFYAAPYTMRPEGLTVNEIRFLSTNLVLHHSTLRGQRMPKGGGETVTFETKYVDLLRRQPDGGWLVVSRMWSDNR